MVKRDLLRPRKYDINLNEKIGKRTEITDSTLDSDKSGWYCHDCKCQLKDSHTYLDHINGKKHQRVLGMSMKTPNSTLQQVKNRFEYHKKRSRSEFEQTMDVKDRIEMRKAKEKRQKELKKQAKKRRKLAKKQAKMDESYGTNYNNNNNHKDDRNKRNKNDKDKSKNTKGDETEYVAEGIDPEMAAMGFTFSFGGSKKT